MTSLFVLFFFARTQIQELKSELSRLFAGGADVNPSILTTYGIAAVASSSAHASSQPTGSMYSRSAPVAASLTSAAEASLRGVFALQSTSHITLLAGNITAN